MEIQWSAVPSCMLPGETMTARVGEFWLTARTVEDTHSCATDYSDEDRIYAWEKGDFVYVGVVVKVELPEGDEPGCDWLECGSSSLWSIESDSDPSYFVSVAGELADEALDEARAYVARLRVRLNNLPA